MERHGNLQTSRIDGTLKSSNALGIAMGGAGPAATAANYNEVRVIMTSNKQVVTKKSKCDAFCYRNMVVQMGILFVTGMM